MMSDELLSLNAILEPPTQVKVSAREIREVERNLGISLPAAVRLLVSQYGAGAVNDYLVLLGVNAQKAFLDIQHRGRQECEATRSFCEKYRLPTPMPLHPDKGGCFPWAFSADGDLLFFSPTDENWVGMFPRQSNRWEVFRMDVLSFLIRLFSGELNLPVFSAAFPADTVLFVSEMEAS